MRKNTFYIKRGLEKEILPYLDSPEIIAIIGSRQCGKTTLVQHITKELKGKTVNFLDFEDRDELNLFINDIKAFIKLHVEGKDYLIIDEFQYAIDGGKQLKYIYDSCQIKIIITGSSATELSIQSIRHLVGRIFVFVLYPFSFDEFLSFRNPALSQLAEENQPLSSAFIQKINPYYQEYVIYGGYPRVILAQSLQEKELILKNIFQTYLLKEVRQILNYQNDLKLEKLIKALSLQISNICSYNELSLLTGFKNQELLKALDILTKTFIIAPCRPFFTNKRLELVKSLKYYFIDNGFRNISIKNFNSIENRTDLGSLNENFIASELLKADFDIQYWRTKSKAEVDFVIDKGNRVIPIEVKSSTGGAKMTRSFRSFFEKYKPPHGILSSKDHYSEQAIENIPIYFRPHWSTVKEI